jgi:hypothetical protein
MERDKGRERLRRRVPDRSRSTEPEACQGNHRIGHYYKAKSSPNLDFVWLDHGSGPAKATVGPSIGRQAPSQRPRAGVGRACLMCLSGLRDVYDEVSDRPE